MIQYNKHDKYFNQNNCLLIDNVLIDWSAKAGCTTVVQMVFKKLGILKLALDYHPTGWVHDFRQDRYYRMYKEHADETYFRSKDIVKIKFVRDPYARAVSSYIHMNRTRIQTEFPANTSFELFLKLLRDQKINFNPHWAYQCRPNEINSINNGRYIFNSVLKIEDLPTCLESVKHIVDLEPIHYNKHHVSYTETDTYEYVGDKPWDQLRDNIPNPTNFYNEHTIQLVEDVYKYDITLYNYNNLKWFTPQ